MQKQDVFKRYKNTMISSVPPRPHVKYSRFISLWNTVFPKCRRRPWCNVPGKCDICYEIDRMRREADDKIVLAKLQEAHHLHRAGMLMLERNR